MNGLITFTSQLSRVILLRRLHLPLPTVRNCRCGLPFDSRGHHRAACARAWVLGGRGWAVENAAARIREAGRRVTTNVQVRDLDLAAPHIDDARRLEVVVDWLPLFGGAQLAVDTTLVSALRADGSCRRRAAQHDGLAAEAARLRKARTCPELVGLHRRVVLALEVGGSWPRETQAFVTQLAGAKARGETQLMRRHAEQGWRLRWGSILACVAARAVASTMLALP